MTEFKDIYQLKKEFDNLPQGDNLAYIKFHEKNLDSIQNINPEINSEHFNAKLRFECEYGLSLIGHGILYSGIKVLNGAIKTFEDSYDQNEKEIKENNYYQSMLWNLAIGHFNNKDFNQAELLFNKLVEYYPENENYQKWLNQTKNKKLSNIRKPLWIVFLIWFILKFVVFDKFAPEFKFWNLLFGITLLTIILLIDGYLYLNQRKIKRIKKAHTPNTGS